MRKLICHGCGFIITFAIVTMVVVAARGIAHKSVAIDSPQIQSFVTGSTRDCEANVDSNMANGIIQSDLNLVGSALQKIGAQPQLFRDVDAVELSTELLKTPNDKGIFFFYSGHGIFRPATLSEDEMTGESRICLGKNKNDFGDGVAFSTLFQDTRAGWIVALVNSCFSGYSDLKDIGRPYSIITSSEQTQTALGGVSSDKGTLVARAFASVVEGKRFYCSDTEDSQDSDNPARLDGSPDSNCDGMITDMELLEGMQSRLYRCANALAAYYPLRLMIRSNVSGQLPVTAYAPRGGDAGCNMTQTFQRMKKMVSRLDDKYVEEKEELLRLFRVHAQIAYRINGASMQEGDQDESALEDVLPLEGKWDFFVMDEYEKHADVRQQALKSGLHPFPGKVGDARQFAKFTIGPRIYHLIVDENERWLDIVSLRNNRLVRTITMDRSADESVKHYHDTILRVLSRLSNRVATVYDLIGDWYEVRFDGRLPKNKLPILLNDGEELIFNLETAISVPCVEEDGLCFRVPKQ